MKGYILNPDTEYVKKIIDGIEANNGHCPCRVKKDESTYCPCEDFLSGQGCSCLLFVDRQ